MAKRCRICDEFVVCVFTDEKGAQKGGTALLLREMARFSGAKRSDGRRRRADEGAKYKWARCD